MTIAPWCRNRYSGNNHHPRYTHYAVTIFMNASFFLRVEKASEREKRAGCSENARDRTLRLPAPIVWKWSSSRVPSLYSTRSFSLSFSEWSTAKSRSIGLYIGPRNHAIQFIEPSRFFFATWLSLRIVAFPHPSFLFFSRKENKKVITTLFLLFFHANLEHVRMSFSILGSKNLAKVFPSIVTLMLI